MEAAKIVCASTERRRCSKISDSSCLRAPGARSIRHLSPGIGILFGDRGGAQGIETLGASFAQTPVNAQASATILQDLWEKWCMLAPRAAQTCLMRGTGEIMASDPGPAIAEGTIAERRAIADSSGCASRSSIVLRHNNGRVIVIITEP
jgi:ketopantoate reductase